jgi:hypothetical protein
LGDPDRDGKLNILEYALVTDPRVPGVPALPSTALVTNPADDQTYLEFTYRRRIGAPGLTYLLETSADCIGWTSDPAWYQHVAGPMPTMDGISEIITERLLPAVNSAGDAARFGRVRIVAP